MYQWDVSPSERIHRCDPSEVLRIGVYTEDVPSAATDMTTLNVAGITDWGSECNLGDMFLPPNTYGKWVHGTPENTCSTPVNLKGFKSVRLSLRNSNNTAEGKKWGCKQ
ncbi:uncharacterized protein LOC142357351, partial [Convolutriloba macropyga]|uniref:uncharacterized protein LOC142357351 n=1 Tax=Convolutriloba macropyga TaxID=536237 RepID=UPI003F51EB5E